MPRDLTFLSAEEIGKHLARGAALADEEVLGALADDRPNLRIAELQVVLEFVDVHEPASRMPSFSRMTYSLLRWTRLTTRAERIPGLGEGETLVVSRVWWKREVAHSSGW